MQFARPRKRQPREATVPMINVVFLLLIFFLMTATIAPQDPLDVSPPMATSDPAEPAKALVVAADGTVALGEMRGQAAIDGVVSNGPVTLRVDAGLPGANLAELLARLAALGVGQAQIVTVSP